MKPNDKNKDIKSTLSSLSKEDLLRITEEHALYNTQFRFHIQAEAQMQKDETDKADYRRIIRDSFRAFADRHGLVSSWAAMRAVRVTDTLLTKADSMVKKNHITKAIPIYQAVFEEMIKSLDYVNDSSGTVEGLIRYSLKGLESCVAVPMGTSKKEELFDYLFKESKKKEYQGWDWRWDLIRMAASLVADAPTCRKVFNALESLCKKDEEHTFSHDYNREKMLEIRCLVLKNLGRDKELKKTIDENLEFPSIRRKVVDETILECRFQDAKKLIQDGIKLAIAKRLSGLGIEWTSRLLDVFKLENNTKEILKYSRHLFLRTNEFKYYDELKRSHSPEEWSDCVQELVSEISSGNPHSDTIGEIYVREKKWQELQSFVESQSDSIYVVRAYHKYLIGRYPQELSKMYKKAISEMVEEAKNRKEYVKVCQAVDEMKECGIEEDVHELADWIRRTYICRPALLEELNRVAKNS